MFFAIYNRLNLHVSATPREVIRAARGTMLRPRRMERAHRISRRHFYRCMLLEHRDARELYRIATGSI